jgi:glyoxylase I family protein
MAIAIKTPGLHHVALRSADFQRSRKFYVETLGFPVAMETDNLVIFLVGNAAVGVRGAEPDTPAGDSFNPHRVGLDHIAMACEDEAEIDRVAGQLSGEGIWNTGAKMDPTLGKKYVAFKDPDGIKWELYMA